jgi:hypothetical protein
VVGFLEHFRIWIVELWLALASDILFDARLRICWNGQETKRLLNTTTTQALLRRKTPFEVWFSWKPRWITAGPMNDVDDEDQDL